MTHGGRAGQSLEHRNKHRESAENPLHHRVDDLHSLSARGDEATSLNLSVVSLSDVKLKEGCVDEIGRRGKEAQLEGKFVALGHIGARGSETGCVRREGHYRVEGEEKGIEQETGDVVEALVQDQALRQHIQPFSPTEAAPDLLIAAIFSGSPARVVVCPA